MINNAKTKHIHVDCLNGHIDHVHCLVSLNKEQTISKTIQLLKGESSFWINKNNLCDYRFEWQTEYFAVSIGESSINKVRGYIKNQEEHHKKKSFQEEYDEFINKYRFESQRG
jgi:REP element-mobilizing transposase RayT